MKPNLNLEALKKELHKRAEQKAIEAAAPVFDIGRFCFKEQKAFINDDSRLKTALCSRRAGKTVGCAADLLYSAKNKSGIVNLYITLSRKNAKRIIWKDLLRINRIFQLGGHVDNTELTITFTHDDGDESIIYIAGAKDKEEIEKFRGLALYKVYIDECQSFRPFIKELIDDIIEPTLLDYDGYLILIGTPGPLCAGYFYECCQSDGWSHHKWTMKSNPHIQTKSNMTVEAILARIRKRKGITEDDPTYRREYLGEWVHDSDSLVYKYSREINHFNSITKNKKMHYIFGIDIGWEDCDAIAVLGYSFDSPEVYLVEEFVKNKLTITDLADEIKCLQVKYDPVKMVMDAGALGKKIQEEIQQRHHLIIEAADKKRKVEFIELLNDDLRTGRLKIKGDSVCAQDYMLIQWDYEKSTNAKRVVSAGFHSDISDAVLYGWREAKHFAYEPTHDEPKSDTTEYMDEMERAEAEEMERKKLGYNSLEPIYDGTKQFWE